MARYTRALVSEGLFETGLKLVAEGNYYKYQKDGKTRVRNMRGDIIEPEGLMLFTKSGNLPAGELMVNFDFHFVRPRGYQTEKPPEMLYKIIKMTTLPGDTIIDPFAGGGVSGEQAVVTNRFAHLIEIDSEAVLNHIIPKIKKVA